MPPSYNGSSDSSRTIAFVILVAVCLLVTGGYALGRMRRSPAPAGAALAAGTSVSVSLAAAGTAAPPPPAAGGATLQPLTSVPAVAATADAAAGAQPTATGQDVSLAPPLLLGIDTNGNVANRHQVELRPLDDQDSPQYHLGLSCERVAFAAGEGLCLTFGADPSTQIKAEFFDSSFHVLHSLTADGFPSRARVSDDGRYGSITVFVLGDSYATTGFSTRSTILDMHAGTAVANLEDFTVYRGNSVIQAQDFNFWGVTFTQDSDHFYATLGTAGKTYLIYGDVATKTAHTLLENVECPSLSPDNQHIVFKRRTADGAHPVWRLYVLDLASMAASPLAETRNVDDQAEWLDNAHVLYTPLGTAQATWEVGIDGTTPPSLYAANEFSPIVIR